MYIVWLDSFCFGSFLLNQDWRICSIWDWGLLRLEKFLDVETDNHPDCKISCFVFVCFKICIEQSYCAIWHNLHFTICIAKFSFHNFQCTVCIAKFALCNLNYKILLLQITSWKLHWSNCIVHWICRQYGGGVVLGGFGCFFRVWVKQVHKLWGASKPTDKHLHQLKPVHPNCNPSWDIETCPYPMKPVDSHWNLLKPIEIRLDTLKLIQIHWNTSRPTKTSPDQLKLFQA